MIAIKLRLDQIDKSKIRQSDARSRLFQPARRAAVFWRGLANKPANAGARVLHIAEKGQEPAWDIE